MKYVFQTDTGKVRHHNEDSGGVFTKRGHFLAIVADGMGGHQAGEVASNESVKSIKEEWDILHLDIPFTQDEARNWLISAISKANKYVYTIAKENLEMRGMGTTIVAVLGNESFAAIAHIGDSRCYMLNQNGFVRKTNDHTLVNELVKSGQITEDEAAFHPRKNVIMKALGTDNSVEPEIIITEWMNGDILLLCSDGLSDKVLHNEMEELMMNSEKTLEEKAAAFIQLANEKGGEDNITVALVEHSYTAMEEGEI